MSQEKQNAMYSEFTLDVLMQLYGIMRDNANAMSDGAFQQLLTLAEHIRDERERIKSLDTPPPMSQASAAAAADSVPLAGSQLIELAMLLQPSFEKGVFVQLVKRGYLNGVYGCIFDIDKHGIHLDLGDMGSTTNGYETVEPEQIKRVSGVFARYCPKCEQIAANQDDGFCECGRALEWTRQANAAHAASPANGDAATGSGEQGNGE
jgi:hypothetical protein